VTVRLIRTAVTDTLRLFGVAEDCVDDIRLALSEACTNVIIHAAGDDEYEVRVRIDGERCAISVSNTGTGFDASGLGGVLPDHDSPRGRGVAIMRSVMDGVQLESQPETGTVVNLVRNLSLRPDGPLSALRPMG
jgi:serine/threonine-protein kinase RsbW